MLVYCDANVFVDVIQQRRSKYRPLGDLAFDFFSRGWNCQFKLVVSKWAFEEATKHISAKDFNDLIDNFKELDKLIWLDYTDEDVAKARKMSANWTDALHVVLALKSKSDVIATVNMKHLRVFSSMIDISYPERI